SLPDWISSNSPAASTILWSALPVNRYETKAVSRKTARSSRKKPKASLNRGSLKNPTLIFPFFALSFFSLEVLNVFDLAVFFAIVLNSQNYAKTFIIAGLNGPLAGPVFAFQTKIPRLSHYRSGRFNSHFH